ncbi:MAG: hypothetical protein NUW12_05285 [Firmicutes bacterium]|jgi:hypothetical protein|nr:hypothetical protein [Bacillota bacterium]MDH7495613.1 hypothetical protein [Bacillota bacterium]
MQEGLEAERVIEDLKFIKTAIAKSGGIMRWLPISQVMRVVYLITGLAMTALCGGLYLLYRFYGSYAESPAWARAALIVLSAAAFAAGGGVKISGLMAAARRIRSEYTLLRLLKEVYSERMVLILVPHVVAGAGVVVFLTIRGLVSYVVPTIAILFGLVMNALINVFDFRELVVSGDWLIATGLVVLFLGNRLDPLLGLVLTFGLGFVAAFVYGTVAARIQAREGEPGRE